ncbi:Metallo-dependent phosphatase-like protein [Limtongia smithiae]|uniref:Metallo-dependent phosphatase-like protein n=1 Tax=Limtongia smithiae TaxID=1125753 RepID=UPI0034CFC8B6
MQSPARLLAAVPLAVVLTAMWVFVLYWGEHGVFAAAVRACRWETWEDWPAGATPVRIAVIADPQLVDENTYKGRPAPLLALTEYYVDKYMHRAWTALHAGLGSKDATVFLGDLFDGGREWDHDTWLAEYERFERVFPFATGDDVTRTGEYGELLLREVAGNHDIGIGDTVVVKALNTFRAYFGDPNRAVEIGNHTLVALDTASLMNTKLEAVYTPPRDFLQSLRESTVTAAETPVLPRILLTHIPLFRPANEACGPKREAGGSLPLSRGYQYQTAVDPDLTTEVLQAVAPVLVLSGDDHDACSYTHTFSPATSDSARTNTPIFSAPEYTVKSFSIAMGVQYPAFELLSLWNPAGENYVRDSSGAAATVQTKLCMLPSLFDIFRTYAKVLVFTAVVVYIASRRAVVLGGTRVRRPSVLYDDDDTDYDMGDASGSGSSIKASWTAATKSASRTTTPSPSTSASSSSTSGNSKRRSRQPWRRRLRLSQRVSARLCGAPGTVRREFSGRMLRLGGVVVTVYLYFLLLRR